MPVALLLLGYGGVPWLRWLVTVPEAPDWKPLANALPVVRAMLVGLALTAVVCWRDLTRLVAILAGAPPTARLLTTC